MLNSGLRTSCATPATIDPISAIFSLCRSCSLSRTVSVTSWKLRTTRPAASPSAASARPLTTHVRRLTGSTVSSGPGRPPVAQRGRELRQRRPRLSAAERGERRVEDVRPRRALRLLDGRAVRAHDATGGVDHQHTERQAVEGVAPLDRGLPQVGLEPAPLGDVGARCRARTRARPAASCIGRLIHEMSRRSPPRVSHSLS